MTDKKIDSPAASPQSQEKDLSGLTNRLRVETLSFNGQPGKFIGSDEPTIQRVGREWFGAEGAGIAVNDKQAVTFAYTAYWQLWNEEKGK